MEWGNYGRSAGSELGKDASGKTLSLLPEASVVLTKPSFRRSTLGGDGQWEGGVSDPVEEGGFRSD